MIEALSVSLCDSGHASLTFLDNGWSWPGWPCHNHATGARGLGPGIYVTCRTFNETQESN